MLGLIAQQFSVLLLKTKLSVQFPPACICAHTCTHVLDMQGAPKELLHCSLQEAEPWSQEHGGCHSICRPGVPQCLCICVGDECAVCRHRQRDRPWDTALGSSSTIGAQVNWGRVTAARNPLHLSSHTALSCKQLCVEWPILGGEPKDWLF